VHRVIALRQTPQLGLSRLRVLPLLARHAVRTMPWAALVSGCVTGTLLLAALAYFADKSHYPLSQTNVRYCFLPAVVAIGFVPRAPVQSVAQAAPAPAWLSSACHIVLAIPVLAATCWAQLGVMSHTLPPGAADRPAVYPLLAQLSGWCAVSVAAAACSDRSRYADLGGAVAAPATMAALALAAFVPATKRILATPPATPGAATIGWYLVTAAALTLTAAALSDRWHRYSRMLVLTARRLERRGPGL
jgi:hypothetical protein